MSDGIRTASGSMSPSRQMNWSQKATHFIRLTCSWVFRGFPPRSDYEYLDIKSTYKGCCEQLRSPRVRAYRLGMALWAGASLDIEPPGHLIDQVNAILRAPHIQRLTTAQDIGMLLSGTTAMAARDGGPWRVAAEALAQYLERHYCHPSSHIFYNQGVGYRRHFSSFASQVYSILALYQFGEALDRDWAVVVANQGAERMIALQGPRGEWGWFYYVPRATNCRLL